MSSFPETKSRPKLEKALKSEQKQTGSGGKGEWGGGPSIFVRSLF